MATKAETRNGTCATHGRVEGTRDVPQPGFPYIVNAVRRAMARRRPFRCPECGEPVSPDA